MPWDNWDIIMLLVHIILELDRSIVQLITLYLEKILMDVNGVVVTLTGFLYITNHFLFKNVLS